MKRIYHICTVAAWDAALAAGAYRGDTLATEGFIHCSTRAQVLTVAEARFRGRLDLILLMIDETAVGCEVRYENLEGGAALFPHLYGPLPVAAVRAVAPLAPEANAGGRFVWPQWPAGSES